MMLLAALLLLSPAQEASNPDYSRWASCKVGSWVKMKTEIETGGNKMAVPTETTFTLIELDEKKAVVEEVTLNLLIDKDSPRQEKSRKRTFRADGKKKADIGKEGDEELEIAGKKLACHWTETTPPAVGTAAPTQKIWTAAEVPGRIVRLEFGGLVGKSITRLFAVAWEQK